MARRKAPDNLESRPLFAQLLWHATNDSGESAEQIASKLAIHYATYRNAETGRASPGVFTLIETVFPEQGPKILSAYLAHRAGAPLSGPREVLTSIGNEQTVGVGSLRDLEDRHNYVRIAEYVGSAPDPHLIVGSPYMRYWLESRSKTRLERLLDDVPHLTVDAVIFDDPDQRNPLSDRLSDIADRYSSRVHAWVVNRPSDISYISYRFRRPDGKTLRRMLIGFQFADYEERPFVEFVSDDDCADAVTQAVLWYHETSAGGVS